MEDYKLDYKMKQASEFASQGKLLHALQVYQGIINEDSLCLDAYIGLAEIYEQLGNPDPAIELLNELLGEDKENKDVRLFLGQYLLRNEEWNDAIDVLSYLLPEEESQVSFYLGYCHYMLNELEIARVNFVNFISNPLKTELYYEANLYLARIDMKLGDYQSALLYAKKAGVMYNNFWDMHGIFAEIYYYMGMYAHAVTPIEKAIRINPSEPRLYDIAGNIYYKLGDYVKAEKSYLKMIESSETISAESYLKLAETYLKLNKLDDAGVYSDLAVKIEPDNKKVKQFIRSISDFIKKDIMTDV